jgi:hypothetical protein
MLPQDRQRVPKNPWLDYLEGNNPAYPEIALRGDLATVRSRVLGMREDTTTPDTRLSDDPMLYNPATVGALVELMMGGLPPGASGKVLHARLRYFDPDLRRAGIPEDVAALVQQMTADSVTLTLVNINQLTPRTVLVQTGAYGEHQCLHVDGGEKNVIIGKPYFQVRLGPGAGGTLVIRLKRYANRPTLDFPWDRKLTE